MFLFTIGLNASFPYNSSMQYWT